jgi:hypothetical protein
MPEIHRDDIPIPLVNYVELIRKGKGPYYDVAKFISDEMIKIKERYGDEFYTLKDYPTLQISPRLVKEEIEKRIKDERLTSINVCRSILATLYGSRLEKEKDFFATTRSGGGIGSYHIKVNQRTLSSISHFV